MREIFKERKEKESSKKLTKETEAEIDKLKNELKTKEKEIKKLHDQLASSDGSDILICYLNGRYSGLFTISVICI